MATNLTRINNNQITDAVGGNTQLGINANTKVQNYSITSQKIANDLTYGSNLTIAGNLDVLGNTTTIDSTTVTVEDPLILLASTQTGTPTVDIGFIGQRGTANNIASVWDEALGAFVTVYTNSTAAATTVNILSYADFITGNANVTGNLIAATLSLSGNVLGNLNVSNSLNAGNVTTPGLVSATGTATVGNLVTAGTITATGNVATAANVLVGGYESVTGNIYGGNITSGGSFTAVGFVAGGNFYSTGDVNLTNAGNVSTSGNVYANNLSTVGNTSTNNLSVRQDASITGNLVVVGNVLANFSVTGQAGVFYGDAQGFGALYAGIANGYVVQPDTISQFSANVNEFAQINLQNINSGNAASTDIVATADNGDNYNYYIDMGIASSTYTGLGANSLGTVIKPNDAWMYTVGNGTTGGAGGNLVIAAATTGGQIKLVPGGGTDSDVVATVKAGQVSVTGNIFNTGVVSTTGNIRGGNLNTVGQVVATANITGGNILTAGLISATGTLNADNIYGNNTSITGNLTVGTTGNITGANVTTPNVITSGTLALVGTTGIQFSTTGNINAGNAKIINVVDPVNSQDAATKIYVDTVAQGLAPKTACDGATTAPLDTLAMVTNVAYNNGTAGVGATLTITTTSQLIIDGLNVATVLAAGTNTRFLIKNELVSSTATSNAAWNGIYTITSSNAGTTVFTRAVDFDVNVEMYSAYTFIQAGTVNADTGWTCTNNATAPITIGTTAIAFIQFSGAGSYTAGAGLSLTGTVFSAETDGNSTYIDVNNKIAVYGNMTFTTPNLANATFSSLSAVGGSGNVYANNISVTGLISTANEIASGNLSATGYVAGGNVFVTSLGNNTVPYANAAGGLLSDSNFTYSANTVNASNVSVTGSVVGTNLYATTLSTAQVTFSNADGKLLGNSNFTTDGSNVTVAGNVSVGGNVNTPEIYVSTLTLGQIAIANTGGQLVGGPDLLWEFSNASLYTTGLKSNGAVSTSGNVTASNFITSGSSGNITGANVISAITFTASGNVYANNINAATDISAAGNIYGNVQGNVTTTNLSVAGNIVAGGNIAALDTVSAVGVVANSLSTTNSILTIGNVTNTTVAIDGAVANLLFVSGTTTSVAIGSNVLSDGATLAVNATDSMLIPVGNSTQRPGSPAVGMTRWNTTIGSLEIWNGIIWAEVGTPDFTVITNEQFDGDGTTLSFSLAGNALTTNSCIVTINGIVQIPTTAYAVTGTVGSGSTITFTEAPQVGDTIDVREITSTKSISTIGGPGSGQVSINGMDVALTGNLVPTANATYSLGEPGNTWSSLYVSGNTIYLGGMELKSSGNTFGVYDSSGNLATVAAGNLTVTTISDGTSSYGFSGLNGNAVIVAAGNTVGNFTPQGLLVYGLISAQGNINAVNASLQGNVRAGGIISATGVITGSNFTTAGAISTTGGVTTAGPVTATGNISTGAGVFATGNVAGSNVNATNRLFGNTLEVTTSAAIANFTITGDTIISSGNTITIDPNTSGGVEGTVVIAGNLEVQGTTTTINSNTVSINDLVFIVANNAATASQANGGGFAVGPDPSHYAELSYNSATGLWDASIGISVNGVVTTASSVSAGSMTATGNITGGNVLYGAGRVSGTGSVFATTVAATSHTGTTVSVTGNINGANVIATNLTGTLSAGAQTGITSVGTLGNLSVTGTVNTGSLNVGNITNSAGNGIGNIGSSSSYFDTVFAKATSAQYADLAEKYLADAEYEPGTVVAFGGVAEVTVSDRDGDRRVAGVVSTNPSYIMNGTLEGTIATVALTGRVPTRVTGSVRKGDLMVSNGDGSARAEADPKAGSIIGKALADFDGATGVIEVVIGRF